MTGSSETDADEDEVDRLLEAILRRYHFDFRRYSRAHLCRRLARARASIGTPTNGELLDRVLSEPAAFTLLLRHLTIQVSDLFRDPGYYRFLREEVLPHLATYPSPRVWVAGCARGEEAYSIAILLHEEGLLERSFIYATDIDAESLDQGVAATYELGRMRGFSENYFLAGGRTSLADYYTAAYSHAAFGPLLRKHILFSDHCLATDVAFAEVHFVSCRNVLIYFDRELQDRAVGVLRDSLCSRGFLGLGAKEALTFSSHRAAFELLGEEQRVYRLRAGSA